MSFKSNEVSGITVNHKDEKLGVSGSEFEIKKREDDELSIDRTKQKKGDQIDISEAVLNQKREGRKTRNKKLDRLIEQKRDQVAQEEKQMNPKSVQNKTTETNQSEKGDKAILADHVDTEILADHVDITVVDKKEAGSKLDALRQEKQKKETQLDIVNNELNKALRKDQQNSRLTTLISQNLMAALKAHNTLVTKGTELEQHIMGANKNLKELELVSKDKGKKSDGDVMEKQFVSLRSQLNEIDQIIQRNKSFYESKATGKLPAAFKTIDQTYQSAETAFSELEEAYTQGGQSIQDIDRSNMRQAEFYEFRLEPEAAAPSTDDSSQPEQLNSEEAQSKDPGMKSAVSGLRADISSLSKKITNEKVKSNKK